MQETILANLELIMKHIVIVTAKEKRLGEPVYLFMLTIPRKILQNRTISTVERSDDPGMMGARSFTREEEFGIGSRLSETRVQLRELAWPKERECTRRMRVMRPIPAFMIDRPVFQCRRGDVWVIMKCGEVGVDDVEKTAVLFVFCADERSYTLSILRPCV